MFRRPAFGVGSMFEIFGIAVLFTETWGWGAVGTVPVAVIVVVFADPEMIGLVSVELPISVITGDVDGTGIPTYPKRL